MSEYNGWKNYETWNIALWIGNCEGLYNIAKHCDNYEDFSMNIREVRQATPDGVNYQDPTLDIKALDEMIKELD